MEFTCKTSRRLLLLAAPAAFLTAMVPDADAALLTVSVGTPGAGVVEVRRDGIVFDYVDGGRTGDYWFPDSVYSSFDLNAIASGEAQLGISGPSEVGFAQTVGLNAAIIRNNAHLFDRWEFRYSTAVEPFRPLEEFYGAIHSTTAPYTRVEFYPGGPVPEPHLDATALFRSDPIAMGSLQWVATNTTTGNQLNGAGPEIELHSFLTVGPINSLIDVLLTGRTNSGRRIEASHTVRIVEFTGPQEVPAPASIVLFGMGVTGVAALRRRRDASRQS